jgi:hypothetical protein
MRSLIPKCVKLLTPIVQSLVNEVPVFEAPDALR